MRTTVGSLSPAVYWRRRVLVLGLVLVTVFLISYGCAGNGGGSRRAASRAGLAAKPSVAPSAVAADRSTPPERITPNPADPASGAPAGDPAGGNNGGASATAVGDGAAAGTALCTDSDLSVAAAAEQTTIVQGATTRFFLRIRNVSSRTCVRNVGATMQELYLQRDGVRQWTSDSCPQRSGDDIVSFPPGHEAEYHVSWDGRATEPGCANRAVLGPGQYQLGGRVGTKVSDLTSFAITA